MNKGGRGKEIYFKAVDSLTESESREHNRSHNILAKPGSGTAVGTKNGHQSMA